MIQIQQLDHLVLTVRNLENSLAFYQSVLGFTPVNFGDSRWALKFGSQKINLHKMTDQILPRAVAPTPGSADLCFMSNTPMTDIINHLHKLNVKIEEGPVNRTGANGKILSIYLRDPDENLIEITNQID